MKNKKNIILISGIILVVILIAGFIFFLGGEEYKMQMPKDAENYLNISLIKKDEKRLIENQENIQKLLDVLFKKERKKNKRRKYSRYSVRCRRKNTNGIYIR